MLATTNGESFAADVLASETPVLVDFYADWCGPCRMLMPIVAELAEEYTAMRMFKVNVDEAQEIANTYGVRNLPTLLIFKDGEVMARSVGSATRLELEKWIQEILGS